MNLQDLPAVDTAESYLSRAFRKASLVAQDRKKGIKSRDNAERKKRLELIRMDAAKSILKQELTSIVKGFPNIDELPVFYLELIKSTLDYAMLKKSLGAVQWAVKRIGMLQESYAGKIKKTQKARDYAVLRRSYYGRLSSVIKQIKPNLDYLEHSRKIIKRYPKIKENAFTVCIFGFPNVGKSTLLSKLTSAQPEISNYLFTTKFLNLGYIREPNAFIQVIDTPGTLNRIDKMNPIEMQAYIAVKHLAELVVYVFDASYDIELEKQERLLKKVKDFKKPILAYISKTDIPDSRKEEILIKYPNAFSDWDALKKEILARAALSQQHCKK